MIHGYCISALTQQEKNDYCPLPLTTGVTVVVVAEESQFQIRCLKKKMRNNVDKW